MNIGYKLVKNAMSATADKAPYLGMAVPVGSLAYDNILKDMIKTGTRLSLPTARFFLEAFYEFAAERIAEEVVRINTGTVAIYPMIDGSFDSEDAEFDPERNSLYIGATLSQSLRDRIAGIVPDATGDETKGTVKMDRIYDIESQTRGVICGTNPFRISGRNLTVPDAEDESLALYAKDGVTKVTDITVSETDEGQWIICQLAGTAAVPKGTYKVRLASHGLDPTDPLTVATLTVTLVEAVPVPPPAWVPEVTEIECKGSTDVIVNGEAAVLSGSHLSGITAENFSEKVTLVSETPAASHIRLSFVSLFENSMEFDVGFEEGFDPSEAEDKSVTLQIRCPDANGNEHLCEIDVAFHAM